jgi:hypothetical protein
MAEDVRLTRRDHELMLSWLDGWRLEDGLECILYVCVCVCVYGSEIPL